MYRWSVFIILLYFTALLAAKSQPAAKMVVKVIDSAQTVEIKNISSGANYFIIDFGDGYLIKDTITTKYTHYYSLPGEYSVCLIAMNLTNVSTTPVSSDTICETVVIPDTSCNAQFDVNIENYTIRLTNLSTGTYKKIYWSVNDVVFSKKETASYSFIRPGIYQVKLTIENDRTGCSSSKDSNITIVGDSFNCVAFYTDSFIDSNTVYFINQSKGNYSQVFWNFGDGSSSTELNPIHTFKHPGKYKVQLNMANDFSQSSYESFIFIENSKIDDLPDFTAITYYDSLGVTFINKSIVKSPSNYIWSFGDGVLSYDSIPEHFYNKPGQYSVCLSLLKNNRIKATTCKTIQVNKPASNFSFTTFIKNKEVIFFPLLDTVPESITWHFGDGNISTSFAPIHIYSKKDVYDVYVKANINGLISEDYQLINLLDNQGKLFVRFKAIQLENDLKQKATGKKVRYRGALTGDVSRIRFQWNYGDGYIDSLSLTNEHTYTENGVYNSCLTVFNDLTGDSATYCQQIAIGDSVYVKQESNPKPEIKIFSSGLQAIANCTFYSSDYAKIDLYDVQGRMVQSVFNGHVEPSVYSFKLKVMSAGIYFLHISLKNQKIVKKIGVY